MTKPKMAVVRTHQPRNSFLEWGVGANWAKNVNYQAYSSCTHSRNKILYLPKLLWFPHIPSVLLLLVEQQLSLWAVIYCRDPSTISSVY